MCSCIDFGCDDFGRPVSEPVVDGHQKRVFEELGQQEQEKQQEAC